MVTRAQIQAQFNHVCDVLLRRGNDSLLKRALIQEGFDDVITLAGIADDMVPLLSYTENNVATVITKGDMGHVRTFVKFAAHRIANGEDVATGWLTVTGEQYDAFRVSSVTAEIAATTIANTGPMTAVAQPRTAVDVFRRGIKLDPSVYPILKDDKLNDIWHRGMLTQARAQGVDRVLDPDYVPNTPEEWALFREMQKYMYAVLETVLRTDRGKAFIRDHEDDFDAQKVYAETLTYHKTSTKAQINASDNLTYITSASIGSNEWQGSTEGFILHW
jgi:hypothetical protein